MDILCCAWAGMGARLICHPFDTIKTVAFSGLAGDPATLSSTSSVVGSAQTIWRCEGLSGLYRGVGIAVIGSAPATALYLGSYHYFAHIFTDVAQRSNRSHELHTSSRIAPASYSCADLGAAFHNLVGRLPHSLTLLLSGFAAEAVSCLLWVPIDVIKERVQSQPPSLTARYRSSGDALYRIMCNEGMRGLYKGYYSTVVSYGPFSAIYFASYEHIKAYMNSMLVLTDGDKAVLGPNAPTPHQKSSSQAQSPNSTFWVAFISGATANAIASVITNPLEFVKTRLQVQRADLRLSLQPHDHLGYAKHSQSISSTRGSVHTHTRVHQAAHLPRKCGSRVVHSTCANPAVVHSPLFPYAYTGLVDGLSTTIRHEGVMALWRGVGARVLYAAPNAALTMTLYEIAKSSVGCA